MAKFIIPSKLIAASATTILLLSACVNPSQNNYNEADVGHTADIAYGIVKSMRPVDITGHNSGIGASAGVMAGGIAGSAIGRGNGSIVGLLGGAIIGGIAGAMTEQALKDRQGIEYTVRFAHHGRTMAIVQNIAKTDIPIARGECVMVQFGLNYQRVLPTDSEDCR